MQTCLNNAMASPATLGVSNAAVFGANLSIIAFAGGFLSTGHNVANYGVSADPYATSLLAFLFAALSVLLILGLCRLRSFAPNVVVLAGLAMGAMWTAATTVLQFYATDVGLSAAVVWSFGDLGRATYKTDAIMAVTVAVGLALFIALSWRYNALLSGDAAARSMGVRVDALRFASLLAASLITAVCVSFLGVIGFVGVICPHAVKKLLGQDQRHTVTASALAGSLLLLLADTVSRSLGSGSALPVGAITSCWARRSSWRSSSREGDGNARHPRSALSLRQARPGAVRVDLTLEDGRIGILLGQNGAGKTTLFKLLLGLEKPESGTILFDGQDLTRLSPQPAGAVRGLCTPAHPLRRADGLRRGAAGPCGQLSACGPGSPTTT